MNNKKYHLISYIRIINSQREKQEYFNHFGLVFHFVWRVHGKSPSLHVKAIFCLKITFIQSQVSVSMIKVSAVSDKELIWLETNSTNNVK